MVLFGQFRAISIENDMKLKTLISSALLATISLITPIAVLSQPSPTGTFMPGFWQPEAQVNPDRPVRFRLLNQAGVPVRYSVTPEPERVLAPGTVGEISTRLSNQTDDHLSINIYSADAEALVYDYNANNNVVTVRIREAEPGAGSEIDRAVYIDEQGRVYSF